MTSSTDLMLRKLDSKQEDSGLSIKPTILKDSALVHQTSDALSPSMDDILTHCLGATKKKELAPGS